MEGRAYHHNDRESLLDIGVIESELIVIGMCRRRWDRQWRRG